MAPRAPGRAGKPDAGAEGVGAVAGAAVDRPVPLGRVLRPDPQGNARRRAGSSGRSSARRLAGLLCYLLLYRSPAMWGCSTGRPLGVIATSTFGVNGATWVPGLLLAGAAVVWLAVSADYATALSLRGLVLVRLLDAELPPAGPRRADGDAGRPVPGHVADLVLRGGARRADTSSA